MAPFWVLEQYGELVALIRQDGAPITYSSLARRADESVSSLPENGVFALECANNLATVEIYIGALRSGRVPVLVDGGLNDSLKEGVYERFNIENIYSSAKGSWLRRGAKSNAPAKLHPELKLLLSTSGSTGAPKLVRLSGTNLSSNASSIATYLGLGPHETAITALPLSYSYGLSILNSHLASGGKIALTDLAVTTPSFWDTFRSAGASSLSGVPATWRILRRMRFERMELPSLRTVTQAGGRLDVEEIQWLSKVNEELGRRVFVMYGQTEATARIAYLPPDLAYSKAGSIGIPIPGGAISVVDGDNNPVPAGVEGQIVYSGPNVMLGYAESPADFALGRSIHSLQTGDLGKFDDDHHLWITGRLSRFIKIFGKRFALDSVDSELRSRGHEAAAVGKDDLLMIGVVGDSALADELRLSIAAHYQLHPSAVSVQPVERIPRNSAGKLLQAELFKMLTDLSSRGVISDR